MNLKHPYSLGMAAILIASTTNPSWAGPPNPTGSDANGNTAGGSGALMNTTTGVFNTGFGLDALNSNTEGNGNTAIGVGVLIHNTTGDTNTGNGLYTLSSNTTGNRNTASGKEALTGNTIGNNNTAIGVEALLSNDIGNYNTASGEGALKGNIDGFDNVANGAHALFISPNANNNTAIGTNALNKATTGNFNTALGSKALFSKVTGANNTALGGQALNKLINGAGNLAIGMNAGLNLTAGNSNIYIANAGGATESATIRIGVPGHAKTFIGGIRGKTTGLSNAVPVLIDGNGQLGTVLSSARYKQDIHDMNDASRDLLKLRPVTFRYKESYEDGGKPLEYGLIAEEVAKVYPDLVAYGADGKVETVQYQKLTPMLLNEMQNLATIATKQDLELTQVRKINRELQYVIRGLQKKVSELEGQRNAVEAINARLNRLEAQQMVGINR